MCEENNRERGNMSGKFILLAMLHMAQSVGREVWETLHNQP